MQIKTDIFNNFREHKVTPRPKHLRGPIWCVHQLPHDSDLDSTSWFLCFLSLPLMTQLTDFCIPLVPSIFHPDNFSLNTTE